VLAGLTRLIRSLALIILIKNLGRHSFLPRSGVLENLLHFPVAPIDFKSSAIPDRRHPPGPTRPNSSRPPSFVRAGSRKMGRERGAASREEEPGGVSSRRRRRSPAASRRGDGGDGSILGRWDASRGESAAKSMWRRCGGGAEAVRRCGGGAEVVLRCGGRAEAVHRASPSRRHRWFALPLFRLAGEEGENGRMGPPEAGARPTARELDLA
jgi:hypothetical protein